jgi:hypothetical protein
MKLTNQIEVEEYAKSLDKMYQEEKGKAIHTYHRQTSFALAKMSAQLKIARGKTSNFDIS